MSWNNFTETERQILYESVNTMNNKDLENSIEHISNKIPNKYIVSDLINDPENKNWKEYVGYDNYVYHTKYDKYDNECKYSNEKYNFLYLKCCGFLLDEIENMIKNIVNSETNIMSCKKKYNKINFCGIEQISFISNSKTTKYDYLNDVLLKWDTENKIYPFNFVKNIIEKKGYDLSISENLDYYEFVIKINEKRERE
jgi:hypothetical protein